jgi:hypothetical protein
MSFVAEQGYTGLVVYGSTSSFVISTPSRQETPRRPPFEPVPGHNATVPVLLLAGMQRVGIVVVLVFNKA